MLICGRFVQLIRLFKNKILCLTSGIQYNSYIIALFPPRFNALSDGVYRQPFLNMDFHYFFFYHDLSACFNLNNGHCCFFIRLFLKYLRHDPCIGCSDSQSLWCSRAAFACLPSSFIFMPFDRDSVSPAPISRSSSGARARDSPPSHRPTNTHSQTFPHKSPDVLRYSLCPGWRNCSFGLEFALNLKIEKVGGNKWFKSFLVFKYFWKWNYYKLFL